MTLLFFLKPHFFGSPPPPPPHATGSSSAGDSFGVEHPGNVNYKLPSARQILAQKRRIERKKKQLRTRLLEVPVAPRTPRDVEQIDILAPVAELDPTDLAFTLPALEHFVGSNIPGVSNIAAELKVLMRHLAEMQEEEEILAIALHLYDD